MVLSCGEGLVLSARSGDKTGEVEVRAGHCAAVAGDFGACSVHHWENVL